MSKKAVILFSSGLDSTTCLAIAKAQEFSCYTMNFDYSQRHRFEVVNAAKLAKQMGVIEHKTLKLNLNEIGGSAITDPTIEVPDFKDSHEIPVTYVPARNTIFLACALGWAEVLGAEAIFIGANDVDYSGYPDCRPEYFNAFEKVASLATKAGVEGNQFKIYAPLLRLSKSEIIKKGLELGVDYSQTVSCYRADDEGRACGRCDSCAFRKKGFKEANVPDPTKYVIS